jgi:flagellar biosynthetic protein FliQ
VLESVGSGDEDMDELIFFDTLRQGLWVAVITSTPILGAALVAGLAVGLLQALTSIQEMTLTFVPKLAAMLAVFWLSMGFMTETLTGYFTGVIVPLIAGG